MADSTTPLWLDITFKVATIFIAIVNTCVAMFVFFRKDKTDKAEKGRDRRFNWFKSVVLDHNLRHFYDFFDNLEEAVRPLDSVPIPLTKLKLIDDNAGDLFISIRHKFVDIFLAVDSELYSRILKRLDELQAHLTVTTFDGTLTSGNFEDKIQSPISVAKTDVLKLVFSFDSKASNT